MRRFVTFALNFSLIKRKTKEMEGLGNLKVNLIISQVRICPIRLLEHSRSIIKLYLLPNSTVNAILQTGSSGSVNA